MDVVIKAPSDTPGEPAATRQETTLANKAEYKTLCATDSSIPIFSTDWWLDAAVGADNWDLAIVKLNGRIVGAMPYATVSRFGMKAIKQPALTPRLGPWLLPNGEKTWRRLGNEQKILTSLIEQLPPFDQFRQTWNTGMSNWLPFYWKGFTQTTDYTYVLSRLKDLDALWEGFDSARRKHCKNGAERYKLSLRDDLPVDAVLALHKKSMQRRGIGQAFTDDCLRRLDAACQQHNCGKTLILVDDKGRHCAGTYTIWDNHCAYGLLKGSDPEMLHTGADSLCQWESLKFSSTVTSKFDFLGNMNESIEPYLRSFGCEQTPIFSLSKTPSRLLRLRQGLHSALQATR
jgi:hypothetical protein